MYFIDIAGQLSGLIAIFSFLTGVTSIRELQKLSSHPTPGGVGQRARSTRLLFASVPIFILSLVFTFSSAMDGSDTGGSQFILLVVAAILLSLYAARWRKRWAWERFLGVCVFVLGGLGYAMGSVSRGEEWEGVQAGVFIGVLVAVLGFAFETRMLGLRAPVDATGHGKNTHEKEILHLAHAQKGTVTASEVALHTSLTLATAKATLEQLAQQNLCQKKSHANGAVSYHFPDLKADLHR